MGISCGIIYAVQAKVLVKVLILLAKVPAAAEVVHKNVGLICSAIAETREAINLHTQSSSKNEVAVATVAAAAAAAAAIQRDVTSSSLV
eukprot:COSAG05_NODE_910_length_6641_cov_27.153776_7_plen_89_part_00